ncbi:unnamed protein product [Lactuca virosa]|uniref:Uncharacterized protein n=1 Tax=Lactuca virosa TaxID=75947 RepID=A0AAU9MEQ9_9ASTR|nr:unnamed protein product [Lactuca virosa]
MKDTQLGSYFENSNYYSLSLKRGGPHISRRAPHYKKDGYNDFNTFCMQMSDLNPKVKTVGFFLCHGFDQLIFNFSRGRLISKTVVESEAGPATIADAMIRGLPIILNDYIADQEVGNVPYVVKNGYGKF